MDRIETLQAADYIARLLRRFGLGRINAAGREIVRRLSGDLLEIEWRGIRLTGQFEHRAYLADLRHDRQESFMLELFTSHLLPGSILLDIGAYIGGYAVLAGRHIGPAGKVVAFEPDPRNFATLARNVRANGLETVVSAVQAACADTNGKATFWLNPGDGSASSLVRPYHEGRQITVPVVRLDDALPSIRPSIIKIDAEGAELGILRGLRGAIERSPHVVIFCECNPGALALTGTSPRELLRELSQLGFRPVVIDETARLLRSPDDIRWDTIKYANLLCTRMEAGERTLGRVGE